MLKAASFTSLKRAKDNWADDSIEFLYQSLADCISFFLHCGTLASCVKYKEEEIDQYTELM